MVLPATGFGTIRSAGWDLLGVRVLVVCLVFCLMIVAVWHFGCRALGAVPALVMGDSVALEGPTWGHSSSKHKEGEAGQRSANQPEFKWIDGKCHFKSKKSGEWVNCEGPPKSSSVVVS